MCVDARQTTGKVQLVSSMLPWAAGTFEARLHYDGHHGVLAISEPFEIVHGELYPEITGRVELSELTEILTRFFREVLEKPDIEETTEFVVDSWSIAIKRAVTEFLESSFSVSISTDVFPRFNTPALIALWVEGACDALGVGVMTSEATLTPNKRKGE